MDCLAPFGRNGCVGCVGCTLPLPLATLSLLGVLGVGLVKAHQASNVTLSKAVAAYFAQTNS